MWNVPLQAMGLQTCLRQDPMKIVGLEKWNSQLAKEVADYIRADAPLVWDEPPLDLVNVANGLLGVAARRLLPHRPDYLSTAQLPVKFDPAATCLAWDKFINDIFPADACEVAYQIAAWLMVPYRQIQKRACSC